MNDKIELPVVVFEEKENAGGPHRQRDPSANPIKEAVIKKMYLDVESISKYGIRKWDNKHAGKSEDWTCLFDKLKHGEVIIVNIPMRDLVAKFTELGIIKVVS